MTAKPADRRNAGQSNAEQRSAARPDDAMRGEGAGALTPLPRDDFDRDVWCVMGLPIDAADLGAAVAAIEAGARDGRRLSFVTPNVNWLVRALKDRAARRAIVNADLSLADGAPIAAIARLLGAPLTSRAAGADILDALRARAGFPGRRLRVFFFGGRDGAAAAAARAIAAERGGVEAAGALNPGHGDVESMSGADMIDAINAAGPDFVVVALGAAKGQAWIERNKARLAAPVIAHLGAAVDFAAGTITRAPVWLRRLGLEWAWRISQEPALMGRYVSDGAALLGFLLTRFIPQLFSGRAPHAASGARKAADAVIKSSQDGVRIALAGDLGAGDLGAVRRAFRQAAAADGGVIVDFSAAGRLDRAFLGLVLMLEKHVCGRGGVLKTAGLAPAQLALFKANAMNYPTADKVGRRPGAEPPAPRAAAR